MGLNHKITCCAGGETYGGLMEQVVNFEALSDKGEARRVAQHEALQGHHCVQFLGLLPAGL